ncbi:RagB/SusD family nutrient uptake outer membrane protein [Pedobacter sp. MW01-1-1]|uniref:RagB/SusD family nutrient uptake outer membrane protein n=1 Tax=Pedobacter sp. MW01-1-1 TaxID=3383027 RepID=UPI003FF1138C
MLKKISFLLLSVVVLSCSKTLEEKPYSSLTVDSFFNNYNEANQAVIGVYSLLPNTNYYKRAFTNVIGFTSDDSYHTGAAFTAFDNGSLEPTNALVASLWNTVFSLHGKANFTVAALNNTEKLSANDKNTMLARVRFARALNLYNAVRIWGDIPLVKEYSVSEENMYPARAPKAQVYAFIEEDLKFAASILPQTVTEYGFPTKGAALGLLGKVYLSEEKWADANTTLDQVIGLKIYSLLPVYTDVFDITKENNAEELFSIQFKKDLQESAENSGGSLLPFWFLPVNSTLGYTADGSQTPGQMRVEHATYDRFTTGDYAGTDSRKLFITSYTLSTTGALSRRYPLITTVAALGPAYSKYRDPSNNLERNYDNNLYILRYADILLMKAEAENELNGPTTAAYAAFNLVRSRSNTKALATGLTKDTFRDAVSRERGIEFFGEFQSWFDQTRMKRNGISYYRYYKELIVSTGKFKNGTEVNYAAYYPKLELMPIPASEIAINKNITAANQNPGY